MRIQGIIKSTMIGVVILLLTLFQVGISHGAEGYGSRNFRVGKNAMVAAGETIAEEIKCISQLFRLRNPSDQAKIPSCSLQTRTDLIHAMFQTQILNYESSE